MKFFTKICIENIFNDFMQLDIVVLSERVFLTWIFYAALKNIIRSRNRNYSRLILYFKLRQWFFPKKDLDQSCNAVSYIIFTLGHPNKQIKLLNCLTMISSI